MNYLISKSGQGTIEYLVVLAVVIVIALVVVGLFTGIFSSPSQQIADSSSKFGQVSSGGISVVEAVIDPQGDALIKLNNLSSDVVSLVKISAGGIDTNPSTNQLVGLTFKDFNLNNLAGVCPCESGQKSVKCDLVIEYTIPPQTTIHTLRKTVTAECVNEVRAGNPDNVVQPIAPVLELGTLANPWIINNCNELQDMNLHLDGNYILGEDIDCSDTVNWNGGEGFEPIGKSSRFIGNFDGENFEISDLFINRVSQTNVALFGAIERANISNVGLVDVNVYGINYVGSLVGLSVYSSINNSYSSGRVTGSSASIVGGIAGGLENSNLINSYSLVNVNSYYYAVGGLIGVSVNSNIINSYYGGSILPLDGGQNGLAYSYGGGIITNSYWDKEVSNTTSSLGGGEGKTTVEMKQQNTYSGWNFDSIWEINEGVSYPILSWQ